MAELSIRKTGGQQQQQPQQGQRQPSAMMHPMRYLRDLMRWDPFSELSPMMGMMQPSQGVIATFDVKETPEAYVFRADLPGFSESDLDISAAGNRLTISGTRRDEWEEKTGTHYVAERRFGTFNRAFTLPQGVDLDRINADLKQGVLTVTVPRMSAGTAKKISVKPVTKS